MKNSNGNALKRQWNQVVVQLLENKSGQRGLIHHLENRRQELTEAVCRWPDLLLKAAQTALGTRVNSRFCEFLAGLSDDCLLQSFDSRNLPEQYLGVLGKVTTMLSKHATPLAFEALVGVNPMSTEISAFVSGWIAFEHEDYWKKTTAAVNSGDEERRLVERVFASQIGFGKVPVVTPLTKLGSFKARKHTINDPRKKVILEEVPWVINDPAVAYSVAEVAKDVIRKSNIPKPFGEYVGKIHAAEGDFLAILRRCWPKLREEAKRWVPGFGLTKVTLDFWGLDPRDIGVVEVTVDPAGREFPALAVQVCLFSYFQETEESFEISPEGVPDLSAWQDDWQRAYRLAVWLAVASCLYKYATLEGEPEAHVQSGSELGEKQGGKRPVPTRFVRLPAGYRASDAAIARAIENRGYAPPPRKTFRMSPPIHERQTPGDYEPITLVAKEPESA